MEFPFRKHKGRHSVYVGSVDADFRPESVFDCPAVLRQMESLYHKLSLNQARLVIRQFNIRQIDTALSAQRWAVLVFAFKPKQPKGGGA